MRALLIHNDNAGSAQPPGTLEAQLHDVGWDVTQTIERKQLDDVLDDKTDVVVVAGGDGTVAKVAKRLAGTNVPLALVPMGTVNNIARSLGIGVDAETVIAGLAETEEWNVDLGKITSAETGEETHFLEGFGMGVFAYLIGAKHETARKKKKVHKALHLVADELETYPAPHYDITIDGNDASGEYILVAVMNMRSFGPALGLAPEALCDDGMLDVCLIRPKDREALMRHLRRAADKGDIALPSFEVVRAKSVSVHCDGKWTHADDKPSELFGAVTIDVEPHAVRFLLPAGTARARRVITGDEE